MDKSQFGNEYDPDSASVELTNGINELRKDCEWIFNVSPEPLLLLDNNGFILKASQKLFELFECSPEDVEGKDFVELIFLDKKNLSIVSENFKKRMSGQAVGPYDIGIITKNNNNISVQINVAPIKDKNSKILGEFVILYDVTERRKMIDDVQKAKERLSSFMESATDAFAILNSNLEVVDVNKAALSFLPKPASPEDIIGKSMFEIIPEAKKKEVCKKYGEVTRTGNPFFIKEYVLPPKFGSRIINIKAFRVGDCIGLIARDITERKEYEQKLAESQSFLKSSRNQLKKIIDGVNQIIVSADAAGNINEWNRRAAMVTGFTKKDFLMKNIYEEKFPQQVMPLITLLKNSLDNHKQLLEEQSLLDRYGNTKTLLSSISIILGNDEEIEGVVLIGRDITYTKHLHNKIMPQHSYIFSSHSSQPLVSLVQAYEQKECPAMIVTRDPLHFTLQDSKNTKILLMHKGNSQEVLQLENIYSEIKKFIPQDKESLVIINRLDYLSMIFGFNELLKFLYLLNDLVRESNSTAIISLPKDFFSEREVAALGQEFIPFPDIEEEGIRLDKRKIDILKFIQNKNSFHYNVQYNLIGKEFNLSRITTKKWISELQMNQLVSIQKTGRTKLIHLTEKGKEFLTKQ